MQLRENISQDVGEAMTRSPMQRVYEIVGIQNMLRDTHGKANLPDILAFYEQLPMGVPITESFINAALCVHSRVLTMPAAEMLLLRLDGLPKARNPFSSIQRGLQCVIFRAQKDNDLLLWFLHGIAHMVEHLGVPPESPDLSSVGLMGDLPGGHVGTLDILAFKKAAHQHIFGIFASDMGLDAAGGDWLLKAKQYYHSHEEYYHSKDPEKELWLMGMTSAQARFMRFAEELMYTAGLDHGIKALLQAGWNATQMGVDLDWSGELKALHGMYSLQLRLYVPQMRILACDEEGSQEQPGGRSGAEPGSRSLICEDPGPRLKSKSRRQLPDFVHLLHLDNLDDAMGEILRTPAGKYQPPTEGTHQKFVGILIDTRVLGEANNRPAIRLPPVHAASVHKLLSAIRNRHGLGFHQTAA